MKVLFICSGNYLNGISPIVKNQGESLRKEGIEIDYFTIKGKGLRGYLKNIIPLRKYIIKNNYNIIHAHYYLSAFVASLTGAKPLIVSLMGSDVKAKNWFKFIIKLFNILFWNVVIVKSKDMSNTLGLNKVEIIPNGVNFNRFFSITKLKAQQNLHWDTNKQHILFAANPVRSEKNYKLAQEAVNIINNKNVEIHFLNDILNEEMPFYFSASDVVLLTSLWEGSPNVIKEAMACNIPIVSTSVGDVKWLIDGVDGCFITSFDPKDVAEKIKLALQFSENVGKTKGRDRIIKLGLDSANVAKRILEVYKNVLKQKANTN